MDYIDHIYRRNELREYATNSLYDEDVDKFIGACIGLFLNSSSSDISPIILRSIIGSLSKITIEQIALYALEDITAHHELADMCMEYINIEDIEMRNIIHSESYEYMKTLIDWIRKYTPITRDMISDIFNFSWYDWSADYIKSLLAEVSIDDGYLFDLLVYTLHCDRDGERCRAKIRFIMDECMLSRDYLESDYELFNAIVNKVDEDTIQLCLSYGMPK